MLRASIDIGSNSTLLLIGRVNEGRVSVELDRSFVTGLGKGIDKTSKFSEESMQATFEALKSYRESIDQFKIDPAEVIVSATEASRVASNAPEFFKKVKDELSFNVQVISGGKEAFYTALGVSSEAEGVSSQVIMDIGGASTELIKVELKPFKVIETISLPIGAVRVKEWLVDGSFDQNIANALSSFDISPYETETLLSVAGTMTSLACMDQGLSSYENDKVHNYILTEESLQKLKAKVRSESIESLQEEFSFLGKRAQVLEGGITVALLLGERLKTKNYLVSTLGLRYGTLIQGIKL